MDGIKPVHKDRLNHMLGMYSDTPGFRNYYCCSPDDPVLVEMQELGLVTLRVRASKDFGGDAIWRATPEGRALVGAPKVGV